jgi:catechol 2,3-dioxygenase-like lactoylglutathione lyase family enzyme
MMDVVGPGSRWVTTVGVGLALLVPVTGCSSDDGDDGASASTTTTSRTTTSSTTTSTTATTEPAAFPREAADYTARLVRAWGVGNRTEAARFAAPSAVEALFGFADPGGPRWDLQGCEGAGGTTYCSYRDPERHTVVLLGIPVANGNTIDGPQEVGSALFQPG